MMGTILWRVAVTASLIWLVVLQGRQHELTVRNLTIAKNNLKLIVEEKAQRDEEAATWEREILRIKAIQQGVIRD